MKLVNIGCGQTFHPAWINLDIVPSAPEVQVLDIRRGLPFADRSCDVCYSSHVLEHLSPDQANFLLREVFRVLRSGGIVRLVVPDLEQIVRGYLLALDQAETGDPQAIAQYDWMVLELLDQLTRSSSGGEMGKFFDRLAPENRDFVRSRIGAELDAYYRTKTHAQQAAQRSIWQKLQEKSPRWYLQKLRYKLANQLVALIAGQNAQRSFQEGLFRNSGEVHRWMYDRFSLRRSLLTIGFIKTQVCQADESQIPGFHQFQLDICQGQVRKPDSLFIEALKP